MNSGFLAAPLLNKQWESGGVGREIGRERRFPLGFRFEITVFFVQGLGLSLGDQALGFAVRVQGLGFRGSGFGFNLSTCRL